MRRLTAVLLISTLPAGFAEASLLPDLKFSAEIAGFAQFKPESVPGQWNSADGRRLKIRSEKISGGEDRAVRIMAARARQEQLLFLPQVAAYPGMFTTGTRCIETVFLERFPRKGEKSIVLRSEMPATSDLIHGTCGSMEEPFWSQHVLLYCRKSGILHDIRYYVPLRGKQERPKKERWPAPVAECP